jgi:hypothetical protein
MSLPIVYRQHQQTATADDQQIRAGRTVPIVCKDAGMAQNPPFASGEIMAQECADEAEIPSLACIQLGNCHHSAQLHQEYHTKKQRNGNTNSHYNIQYSHIHSASNMAPPHEKKRKSSLHIIVWPPKIDFSFFYFIILHSDGFVNFVFVNFF